MASKVPPPEGTRPTTLCRPGPLTRRRGLVSLCIVTAQTGSTQCRSGVSQGRLRARAQSFNHLRQMGGGRIRIYRVPKPDGNDQQRMTNDEIRKNDEARMSKGPTHPA